MLYRDCPTRNYSNYKVAFIILFTKLKTMNTVKLQRLNACSKAIEYVKIQPSIISAWQNCERGDWMLWLAEKLEVDDRKLTLAKAMCVKQVEHLITDQRSKNALQACFDYVNGKITKIELNVYASACACAYATSAAAYAAADAAYADAADTLRLNSLKKSANICREYLTEEVISKYKKLK